MPKSTKQASVPGFATTYGYKMLHWDDIIFSRLEGFCHHISQYAEFRAWLKECDLIIRKEGLQC